MAATGGAPARSMARPCPQRLPNNFGEYHAQPAKNASSAPTITGIQFTFCVRSTISVFPFFYGEFLNREFVNFGNFNRLIANDRTIAGHRHCGVDIISHYNAISRKRVGPTIINNIGIRYRPGFIDWIAWVNNCSADIVKSALPAGNFSLLFRHDRQTENAACKSP
jgi:hypothetical protein